MSVRQAEERQAWTNKDGGRSAVSVASSIAHTSYDSMARTMSSEETRSPQRPSSSSSNVTQQRYTPRLVSPSAFRRASRSRPTSIIAAATQSQPMPAAAFLPISTSTNDLTFMNEKFPIDVGDEDDLDEDDEMDNELNKDEMEEFQVMSLTTSNPHAVHLVEKPWPTTSLANRETDESQHSFTPATTAPSSGPLNAAVTLGADNRTKEALTTQPRRSSATLPLSDKRLDASLPLHSIKKVTIPTATSTGRFGEFLSEGKRLMAAVATTSVRPQSDSTGLEMSAPPKVRSTSRARSTSNSTVLSASTTTSNSETAGGVDEPGGPAIGKHSRLRSLSDNLRRMSINNKQRSSTNNDLQQHTTSPTDGGVQTNSHAPSSFSADGIGTPVRTRKASLTIESLAGNQPANAKTTENVVHYEVLRSDDAVKPPFHSSDGRAPPQRAWTVDAHVPNALPDVRTAGWKVAREDDLTTGIRTDEAYHPASPISPLAPLLRKRASDTGIWQTSDRRTAANVIRSASSAATEVLIPSNFNSSSSSSYPSSRSASQMSGTVTARRKMSISSESVAAADQQSNSDHRPSSTEGTRSASAARQLSPRSSHSPSTRPDVVQQHNFESGPLPPRRRARAGSMGANSAGASGGGGGAAGVRGTQSSAASPHGSSNPPSAWTSAPTTATSTAITGNGSRRRQSTGSEATQAVEQATRNVVSPISSTITMPASPTYPKQEWQHVRSGRNRSAVAAHDSLNSDAFSAAAAATTTTQPSILNPSSSHGHSDSLRPSHVSAITSFTNASDVAGGVINTEGLQTTLDEEDVEITEEEPFIETDTDLYVIRRRLVKQFSDLGRKKRVAPSGRVGDRGEEDEGLSRSDDDVKAEIFTTEKEKRKMLEALEARERALTVEALSKAEMAYAHIEIWTESRKGKWTVRGPFGRSSGEDGDVCSDDQTDSRTTAADKLPEMHNVWAYPIDAKGIVRRNKLKSNIEISSSRTVITCPDCHRQQIAAMVCSTCKGCRRVEMSYVIQCTVRHAQFLPLKLPASLLAGVQQSHIKYVESPDQVRRSDVLRERALTGLQGAASRVVRVHHEQHGSQLLMGRVRISRKGRLTVSVRNAKGKSMRIFDIDDGAQGKMTEVDNGAATSTTTSAKRKSVLGRNIKYLSNSTSLNNVEDVGGTAVAAAADPSNNDENVDSQSHRSLSGGGTSPRTITPAGRSKAILVGDGVNFASINPLASRSSATSIQGELDHDAYLSTPTSQRHLRTPKSSSGALSSTSTTVAQTLSGKKSIRSIFRQRIK